MPRYPVLDTLKTGGVYHKPVATVELDEAQAETLQKLGVVGKALPDEAEDAKPTKSDAAAAGNAKAAPGADGTGQAKEKPAQKPKDKG
jgi:hypothetical protein